MKQYDIEVKSLDQLEAEATAKIDAKAEKSKAFKEIAKNYNKDELVDKILDQWEQFEVVLGIIRVLCNDASTGTQRAQMRELARKYITAYDDAMVDLAKDVELDK
jgi:hypothetical protein